MGVAPAEGAIRVRKRPVEVEAIRLTWPNWNAVCEFIGPQGFEEGCVGGIRTPDGDYQWGEQAQPYDDCEIALSIKTLEGTMILNEGDWLIRGVERELYPCKDTIFAVTYEPV